MREKVLGSIVLVLSAAFATWAIAVDSADRNVVRERSIEDRLVDRGAKEKVPDPAAVEDEDIAVPKEIPVATCPTEACTFHCRSGAGECEEFKEKTCKDKHPLPPGSAAVQFRKVTSFKLGVECAFVCPTASGGAEEYECLTQKEIDARKKKRTGPVSLPPGEQSRFRVPCWLFPWTGYRCTDDDYPSTA